MVKRKKESGKMGKELNGQMKLYKFDQFSLD